MFNFMLTAHLPFYIFSMKCLFSLFSPKRILMLQTQPKIHFNADTAEFLHLFCCTQGYIYFFLLEEPTYFYFHGSVMLLCLLYRLRNAATSEELLKD